MTIDRKEIEALVRFFDQSDWHELRLETDGAQAGALQGCSYGGSGAFGGSDALYGRDRAGGALAVGIHAIRDGCCSQRR